VQAQPCGSSSLRESPPLQPEERQLAAIEGCETEWMRLAWAWPEATFHRIRRPSNERDGGARSRGALEQRVTGGLLPTLEQNFGLVGVG
jgi:hypothetical protein